VSIGGFSGSFGMVRLASTCSRLKLCPKHENELEYLKKELEKLKELTTTAEQTWRDVSESWQATLAMIK
jgi:HPt (histidine-containing phosphotransfer) domain-containing protein